MSLAPNAISDLELWLDADQITGLSDGDTVLTWPDQSGNGNDYTNDGSLATITYETGELNGLPIVTMFDGGFTGPLALASPFSIFYVGRYNEGGTPARRAIQGAALPAWWMGPNSGTWRYNSGAATVNSGVTANTDWIVHGVVQEVLETRELAPLAGGLQYVYDLDTNAVPVVTAAVEAEDIGVLALGNAGVTAIDFGGDLAEVVAYSRVLDPTERVGLTDYFREKWGGIVAASTEDTGTDAQFYREFVAVALSNDTLNAGLRMARQMVDVAHHFPEDLTEMRVARVSVMVAISRPHGWGVHDDPAL